MNQHGRFIVLEGIDGCGSTTQSGLLATALKARGIEVCSTCEPSTGPVGRLIRQALRSELTTGDGAARGLSWAAMALLFAADRVDHVSTVIEPALASGRVVISDRYDLSTLAYQSTTSTEPGDVVPWLRAINARARRPDLTLVLDVSPELAEQRRLARRGQSELYEQCELQRTLADVYRHAEVLVPDDRVVHVLADGTADEVHHRVLTAVLALTPL
jgi:dTMP kinase